MVESLSARLKELTYNLYSSYRSDLWKIFRSKAGSKIHFLLDQGPGAWNEPDNLLGNAIFPGDFNGDGYFYNGGDDLVLGVPYKDVDDKIDAGALATFYNKLNVENIELRNIRLITQALAYQNC